MRDKLIQRTLVALGIALVAMILASLAMIVATVIGRGAMVILVIGFMVFCFTWFVDWATDTR